MKSELLSNFLKVYKIIDVSFGENLDLLIKSKRNCELRAKNNKIYYLHEITLLKDNI